MSEIDYQELKKTGEARKCYRDPNDPTLLVCTVADLVGGEPIIVGTARYRLIDQTRKAQKIDYDIQDKDQSRISKIVDMLDQEVVKGGFILVKK